MSRTDLGSAVEIMTAWIGRRHIVAFVFQPTRWKYRCGNCHQEYGLPGADLSFFYGWFLGVSSNLEAVVFDLNEYQGFDDLRAIIYTLRDELPDEHPGHQTAKVLSEVCDPDSQGDRYVFTGTPGCPLCGSTNVAAFRETQEPWPHPAGEATHVAWDAMNHRAKMVRARVALGLDPQTSVGA